MKTNLKASVILPVYNQKESLKITLRLFNFQTAKPDEFEIIVVDDGSTDGLNAEFESLFSDKCEIHYIRQENRGRSAARNAGARSAKGGRLIFCDADRFPDSDFVEKHIIAGKNDYIAVGCASEFFGKKQLLQDLPSNFEQIKRLSRATLYYKKMTALYDEQGLSVSPIVWASFLVGNSSVGKERFFAVGGFDEEFSTWGFEHFELAFRLFNTGARFKLLSSCGNYHIPHPRESNFYRSMIESSANQLVAKYPEKHFEMLKEYLFGNISLQEFERIFGNPEISTIKTEESIYYKLRSED